MVRLPSPHGTGSDEATTAIRGEWAAAATLAIAIACAAALTATILVAQSALRDASDVVVRGEADALLTNVTRDLADDEGGPMSAAVVERILEQRAPMGLRYLAVYDPGAPLPRAAAGKASLDRAPEGPGLVALAGTVARIAAPLPPPGEGPRPPGPRRAPRPPPPRPPPQDFPPPDDCPPPPGPLGPPLVVIEVETPLVASLKGQIGRTVAVGIVAGIILLGIAAALARTMRRLAANEREKEKERRLVALGRMSSVMAHELRNPLASLKGHAQLLVESLEDEKPKAKAVRVLGEARRLEHLTTSLLDFVRDAPPDLRPVPPEEIVRRALEHLARERVAVDVSLAPPLVRVDLCAWRGRWRTWWRTHSTRVTPRSSFASPRPGTTWRSRSATTDPA